MLTEEEQTAMNQILDIAVKAQGLAIAENCVYFANKFKQEPKTQKGKSKE